MRRTRLLGLAALSGTALAAGYLVARPGGDPSGSVAGRPTPRPAVRVTLDRAAAPLHLRSPQSVIASTAKIVAREPDPAGGPDWVLRTYQRAAQSGAGRVWCAQLGRLVDGEFAWVGAGERRARLLQLGDVGSTSCATTAPISQRLGVDVGGFPDGKPGDPATRVRTAIVWGVVDRTVTSARIERSALAGPVQVIRHGFLRVQESDGPPPPVRLVVRDVDGGQRAAIPPASFGALPLPNPPATRKRLPFAPDPSDRTVPDGFARAAPERFAAVAKLPPDRLGVVQAIFAMRDTRRRPCVTDALGTIGGRPVRGGPGWNELSLYTEPEMQCRYVPAAADRKPTMLGGGGSSGFDPDYGAVSAAQRRQLTERRRPPVEAGLTVATPPGTRLLEVRTPVGVTTVRVTWARVTVVQWDGQPEVSEAMFPRYRKVHGITTRIGGQGIVVRALDAAGHQIGRTTRLP